MQWCPIREPERRFSSGVSAVSSCQNHIDATGFAISAERRSTWTGIHEMSQSATYARARRIKECIDAVQARLLRQYEEMKITKSADEVEELAREECVAGTKQGALRWVGAD